MGPGYFVIAILGCADGSADCTRVATMPTRYESVGACTAATGPALFANSDFDFPTIVAECRSAEQPVASDREEPRAIPAGARNG